MFYSAREALAPVLNQYASAAQEYRMALYRLQSDLATDDLRMAQGHTPEGYVMDAATRMVRGQGRMKTLAEVIKAVATADEKSWVEEFLAKALQGENVIAVTSTEDLPVDLPFVNA